LKEQAELLEEAKEEGLKRIAARDAADALEDPVRFVYSTQKLAYTEIKKEHMRNRLSKAKNCTFTYSQQVSERSERALIIQLNSYSFDSLHSFCSCFIKNAHNLASLGAVHLSDRQHGRR